MKLTSRCPITSRYYHISVNKWENKHLNSIFHFILILYGKDGRFDERKNCQGKNTVTAISTLGDSCEICFQEYFSDSCDNQSETNGMDIKILLSHNSLFILHPSDEMPMNWRSNTTKTFFKHGVPKFGGDSLLSCAHGRLRSMHLQGKTSMMIQDRM